jgi:NAD(P)-dependent dehydrogenase (short-subunit alcohol dehydrogenase family)
MRKVALVTGATDGIGKAAAMALAAQGLQVIVAGRNPEKARQTVHWIQSETSNDAVGSVLGDLSDLAQVRALAAAVQERTKRLDVLINNAGAFFNARIDTPYGVEKTFLVNHLAPFLLTNLLLDTLRASAPARIVNVASEAHQNGALDLDDLAFERGFMGFKAYARSKLAVVLFTYELARRLAGTGVTANALHPGHVATHIFKDDFGWVGTIVQRVMGWFAESPERAAQRLVYLATADEMAGISGRYYVDGREAQSAAASYDRDLAQRLWQVSERLTGTDQSRLEAVARPRGEEHLSGTSTGPMAGT